MKQINALTVIALASILGLAACNSRAVTTSVVPTPVSIIPTATPLPDSTATAAPTATETPTQISTETPTAILTATPCLAPTPGGLVGQIVFSAVPCAEAGIDCEVHEGSVANIYLINSDGTGLRQLVTGGRFPQGLSLSPDGSKIAFMDSREDVEYVHLRSHLYVWNASTGDVQSLMADLPNENSSLPPQWFPDSNRVVYASTIVDGWGTSIQYSQTELYSVQIDGAGRTKITERPSRSRIDFVAVSPDGSQIAFIGREFEPSEEVTAYCVNADGSNLHELMVLPVEAYQPELFWSPDGSEIFISDRLVSNPSSFVVRADGVTAPTKVPQIPGYITGWRWTAGSVVEFSVCERNVSASIWAMRTNSSDLGKLGDIPGECLQMSNRWSPDSTQVVFSEHIGPPELLGLYVLDVNTGCKRQILGGYYVLDLFWLPADVAVP